MCHRPSYGAAALLASFTTSPSCSRSQSATYCSSVPSTSPLHIPCSHIFALLVSFLTYSTFSLSSLWFSLSTQFFPAFSPQTSFLLLLRLFILHCLLHFFYLILLAAWTFLSPPHKTFSSCGSWQSLFLILAWLLATFDSSDCNNRDFF